MNMLKKATIATALLSTALLGAATLAQAELVIIVNAGYSASAASPEEVSKVFLSKSNSLPGGSTLIPVDQSEGSANRNDFYKKVTGKDPAQVNAYWSGLIFTGKGQPPKQVGGDAEVVGLVSKNPNMIGYVQSSAVAGGVKVVAKVP